MFLFESLVNKLKTTVKTRNESMELLQELDTRCGYSHTYFSEQWNRQKRIQCEVIGDTDLRQPQDQLVELIEYEEELRESKQVSEHLILFLTKLICDTSSERHRKIYSAVDVGTPRKLIRLQVYLGRLGFWRKRLKGFC